MDQIAAAFGDQAELAERVLSELGIEGDDGSHDGSHLLRVWRNATLIADQEGGYDRAILAAAILLHDCVAVEKNSPDRPLASRLAAARAREVLAAIGWDNDRIDATAHAIEAHSFSAAIPPRTLEARIVQDADRLDSIGAVGVARCFYVAGRMRSRLYDYTDPQAAHRDLDDQRFALDHFAAKLFKVVAGFQTREGQALAEAKGRTMRDFVRAMLEEIGE